MLAALGGFGARPESVKVSLLSSMKPGDLDVFWILCILVLHGLKSDDVIVTFQNQYDRSEKKRQF